MPVKTKNIISIETAEVDFLADKSYPVAAIKTSVDREAVSYVHTYHILTSDVQYIEADRAEYDTVWKDDKTARIGRTGAPVYNGAITEQYLVVSEKGEAVLLDEAKVTKKILKKSTVFSDLNAGRL